MKPHTNQAWWCLRRLSNHENLTSLQPYPADLWGRSGWEEDRRSKSELPSEMERCRGRWGGCVVFFESERSLFSFSFSSFFWLSSSDWRASATWNLCKSGTIHPTKTNPHYEPEARRADENKWVWIQNTGLFCTIHNIEMCRLLFCGCPKLKNCCNKVEDICIFFYLPSSYK